MDQLGEDATDRQLTDMVTGDSLAVTALGLALTSLLANGLFQFLAFVVSPGRGPAAQFVIGALPVLVFALLGVVGARAAWRRGVSGPAYAAVAGAGLLIGGLVALVVAMGIVVALVAGDL